MSNQASVGGNSIFAVHIAEVVGYADYFTETIIPRRVAPVFRLEGGESYIVPPFRLISNLILKRNDDVVLATRAQFERFVAEKKITEFNSPFPAVPQGLLWIDERLEAHYGAAEEENAKLHQQAYQRIREGINALEEGRLEEALRHARWAGAADEKSLKATALEIAVYRIQGRKDSEDLARETAEQTKLSDIGFLDAEVTLLYKKFPSVHSI